MTCSYFDSLSMIATIIKADVCVNIRPSQSNRRNKNSAITYTLLLLFSARKSSAESEEHQCPL